MRKFTLLLGILCVVGIDIANASELFFRKNVEGVAQSDRLNPRSIERTAQHLKDLATQRLLENVEEAKTALLSEDVAIVNIVLNDDCNLTDYSYFVGSQKRVDLKYTCMGEILYKRK